MLNGYQIEHRINEQGVFLPRSLGIVDSGMMEFRGNLPNMLLFPCDRAGVFLAFRDPKEFVKPIIHGILPSLGSIRRSMSP